MSKWLRCVVTACVLSLFGILLPAMPAQASGDDYPYKYYVDGQIDPWGFTMRQATSFAAWREYQFNRPLSNSVQRWGTPGQWDTVAARLGVRISSYPVVGAIAQMHPNEQFSYYRNGSTTANGTLVASAQGHVAIVIQVLPDLSALVEQYNGTVYRAYSQTHIRAPRYLLDGVGGWPVARPY